MGIEDVLQTFLFTVRPHFYLFPQLLDVLKNVTFTDGRNSFHFDAHGDLNTGYDVVLWKETNGLMTVTKMAEYDLQRDVFVTTNQETKREFWKLKVIFVLGWFLLNSGQLVYLTWESPARRRGLQQ